MLGDSTTLSITTFSLMTLSLKGLYVTLSIKDTKHNNALPLCWVSHLIYCYAEWVSWSQPASVFFYPNLRIILSSNIPQIHYKFVDLEISRFFQANKTNLILFAFRNKFFISDDKAKSNATSEMILLQRKMH